MKICYQSAMRTIWIKHWDNETNVYEPGYNAGQFAPHYPVPDIRREYTVWSDNPEMGFPSNPPLSMSAWESAARCGVIVTLIRLLTETKPNHWST